MKKLKIMTWNTQLFEYGNLMCDKSVKAIDYVKCNAVLLYIKNHIDENENAVAVLQEIPLRSNLTSSEHIIFTLLCGAFPDNEYTILYNVNETIRNQIKMTVVISKKGLIKKDINGINNSYRDFCNCFVSFVVNDLKLLAVHQSLGDAFVNDRLDGYSPDIILGDFNAGDYASCSYRREYLDLLQNGYKDLCNGQNTRWRKSHDETIHKTPIDHVLIKINLMTRCSNLIVHEEIKFSDHFPITFEIDVD